MTGLVRTRRPMNALPDLVGEVARFLRREWPRWGSRRIAGILSRMGLQASRTSVQRILRRGRPRRKSPRLPRSLFPIRAQEPRQVYAIDFTWVRGLFRSVLVGAVIDLFSRKVLALRVAGGEPDAAFALGLLDRAIRDHGKPRRILTDRGTQFTSRRFRTALRRRGIRRRFGAIGREGLPTIDRFWLTMKVERARGMLLYRPLAAIERELCHYATWFNRWRPHWGLGMRTPDDVFFERPLRRGRRIEDATLEVRFHAGDRELPVFKLTRSA